MLWNRNQSEGYLCSLEKKFKGSSAFLRKFLNDNSNMRQLLHISYVQYGDATLFISIVT